MTAIVTSVTYIIGYRQQTLTVVPWQTMDTKN